MGRARIIQVKDENGMRINAESHGERLSVSFTNVEMYQAPFGQKNIKAIEAPENVIERPPEPELSEGDRALEKALRQARNARAREMRVPPYTIFRDRTIYDLIVKKPKTKEELTGIYGIGQAKAEKYGDMILKILENGGDGGQEAQHG